MKIKVDVTLSTDGDFSLLDYNPSIREKAKLYIADFEWYNIYAEFEGENRLSCKIDARIFLEHILCDIRVHSNYYLIPVIFNMFDKACKFIHNSGNSNHYYGCIDGNYSGTEIKIWFLE